MLIFCRRGVRRGENFGFFGQNIAGNKKSPSGSRNATKRIQVAEIEYQFDENCLKLVQGIK
jgi:hypothetical protein